MTGNVCLPVVLRGHREGISMTRVSVALEMLKVIIYSQLYAKLFLKVISSSY